jgi:hypothetical protein
MWPRAESGSRVLDQECAAQFFRLLGQDLRIGDCLFRD